MTFNEWWKKEISTENRGAGDTAPNKMMCKRAYRAGVLQQEENLKITIKYLNEFKDHSADLEDELAKNEDLRGCPCLYIGACKDSCSCANPEMSGGCDKCCSYGSSDQRINKAKIISNKLREDLGSR